MGSGKTTLGKILAKHLNLAFIDLDSYIESEYNLSVHEIFDKYGEEYGVKFKYFETKLNEDTVGLAAGYALGYGLSLVFGDDWS